VKIRRDPRQQTPDDPPLTRRMKKKELHPGDGDLPARSLSESVQPLFIGQVVGVRLQARDICQSREGLTHTRIDPLQSGQDLMPNEVPGQIEVGIALINPERGFLRLKKFQNFFSCQIQQGADNPAVLNGPHRRDTSQPLYPAGTNNVMKDCLGLIVQCVACGDAGATVSPSQMDEILIALTTGDCFQVLFLFGGELRNRDSLSMKRDI